MIRTLPFGKDAERLARLQYAQGLLEGSLAFALTQIYRDRAKSPAERAEQRDFEERIPGHETNRALDRQQDENPVQIGRMIARDDDRALRRDIPHSVIFEREEQAEKRPEQFFDQ